MPSPELASWAIDAFVMDGPLFNPDHEHLAGASIGFLLSTVQFEQQGKRTLGTAEMGEQSGKPWTKGKREQQIVEWFGEVPDFIITLDAIFLSTCELVQACALTEHELYHCGVKLKDGEPVYDRHGAPVFALRPHDVEEFTGVVRRYGAWKEDLEEFAIALGSGPEIGLAKIDGYCGCGRSLA